MLVVMKLKILRVKKIIFFCSLLLFLFDLNASEKKEEKIETRISGYWTHYCKNYEKQRQCEIARKINIEQQNETFLIVFKINKDIKSKIKKTTLRYGVAISTYHFIFHTPVDGISASIGTLASYIYVDSLSSYVDNIEKKQGLNKRLLVPTFLALSESMWNSSSLPFDFNMVIISLN